jgi:YbdK family carboxylate-amine ligase
MARVSPVRPESTRPRATAPWSKWRHGSEYTLGVEEEVMLLDPRDWSLAPAIDDVLAALSDELCDHVSSETHSSAVELRTGVHRTVGDAVEELGELRAQLLDVVSSLGLAVATAGTHPSAVWHEMAVSSRERHQEVYGSMRELARREPTFALHVHVGVPTGEAGIAAFNRLRAHIPILLALSANSPFWQGRDTGLASARTPLFQAFPRVGIPRAFGSYGEYVRAVNLLLECHAFPDHTCGGTCARSRAWAPSRCGSWTRSRRSAEPRRSSRSCSRSRASSSSTAMPTQRSCTHRRCSTRTASSPRATASTPTSSIPSSDAPCRSSTTSPTC